MQLCIIMSTTGAEVRERSENFRHEQDSNPDLCDASAVLYQLNYQTNWELAIMWVHVNLGISGHKINYICCRSD